MAIREELDAINAGFGEAFATQDAERLAGFYADDARLLFPGEPIIRGRAAVDAALRAMVEGGPGRKSPRRGPAPGTVRIVWRP